MEHNMPQEEILDGLVTVGYLCRLFDRSELTVAHWRAREGLPYVRIPGDARDVIRFRLGAVMQWARSHGKRLHPVPEVSDG